MYKKQKTELQQRRLKRKENFEPRIKNIDGNKQIK
jgi:hypothetical protein